MYTRNLMMIHKQSTRTRVFIFVIAELSLPRFVSFASIPVYHRLSVFFSFEVLKLLIFLVLFAL